MGLFDVGAVSSAVGTVAGAAQGADRVTTLVKDFAGTSGGTPAGAINSLKLSAKFAADLFMQASLSSAPAIPAPHFAPLLYCTEYESVFGGGAFSSVIGASSQSSTNGIVGFSFQDIGNLFIEDQSQPRAIPVQQVPDSDEDNVQDMGRSSGYIKISGRVFGQAGLSRFEMLRNLCKYKGKEGLVFMDKNIGKYRVYPANIPGYTSSAEFFNQYAFQVTFIIVKDTNKKSLLHNAVALGLAAGYAAANAKQTAKAYLKRSLDSFKKVSDIYTASERDEELKKVLKAYNKDVNDDQVDDVSTVLNYGISRTAVANVEEFDYPEFTSVSGAPILKLRNIVPSKVMSNGFTDGVTKEYWLPAMEAGEPVEIHFKRVYQTLVEDDIIDDTVPNADRGKLIQGSTWRKQSIGSDYTIVDSMLRPGYDGNWTKITFTTPLLKWGIVKVDYSIPKASSFEMYNGDTVLFGEGLMYIDRISGNVRESQIGVDLVPYPISGSALNVIEEAGVTELYVPELLDDAGTLSQVKVKKRVGSASDSEMEEVTNVSVEASANWEGGKSGRWGKITFTEELLVGDFISVDAVFKEDVSFFSFTHPDYTISNDDGEITFKWLNRPRISQTGLAVLNMVLSPDTPDNVGSIYNESFLTSDGETDYWVKGGVNELESVAIRISNGHGIMGEIVPADYTIEYDTIRIGYGGVWAKITFNSAPEKDRVLTIDCRLRTSITVFTGSFENAEIYVDAKGVDLLWQEAIDDPYIENTYRGIYPVPDGHITGRNGVTPASVSVFWVPEVVYIAETYLSELYPLRVKVNGSISGGYTLEQSSEKIVGTSIENWTKIIFNSPVDEGSIVTVDFSGQDEVTVYERKYLEDIPTNIFTDETSPMKNKLNTTRYFTDFIIDTNKPVEIRIDELLLPKSHYSITKAATRVHENADGCEVRELVGQIDFAYPPGDETNINVKYNRLETPTEESFLYSKYFASDLPNYEEVKDYYRRKNLEPDISEVTNKNNSPYDLLRREYVYNKEKYITYAENELAAEFVFLPYDGIGADYRTKANRYSFEGGSFDTGLNSNTSRFNQFNTPFSVDLQIPSEGQADWIGRFNSLVSQYKDPTPYQEREMASMLLGKLVDNADFSDDLNISGEDVTNAKLWYQVYNSYVDNEDFLEAQKMLDERTALLQLGINGTPKEQDKNNIVTVPSEEPDPIDLPPVDGWRVTEYLNVMSYTKESVDVILLDRYNDEIANLKTDYRTAMEQGLRVGILTNADGMAFYDSSKALRLRVIVGRKTEEYQFSLISELIDALIDGQTVSTDNGDVDLLPSELVNMPELVEAKGNLVPKRFNMSTFRAEKFEIDKRSYEVFLLSIYSDIDAIYKNKQYPYSKYLKYQEIVGMGESSLSLEDGLAFLKFGKISPAI